MLKKEFTRKGQTEEHQKAVKNIAEGFPKITNVLIKKKKCVYIYIKGS